MKPKGATSKAPAGKPGSKSGHSSDRARRELRRRPSTEVKSARHAKSAKGTLAVSETPGSVGFASIDPAGRFIEIDVKGAAILGKSPRFLRGKAIPGLLRKEDGRRWRDHLKECQQGSRLVSSVVHLAEAAEGPGLIQLVTIPTPANGEGRRLLPTAIIDLGRAQRNREELEESEARFRRIVTTAEEGVWTIDAEEKTTFVNPKMAQMLGYKLGEMAGRGVREFLDMEGKDLFEEKIRRRKAGISEQYEFKFRRKTGSVFWAQVSCAPILDAEGKYAGSLAMLTDIDERKRVEEALQRNEERYRLVADGTKTGFWDWDLRTDKVYYSAGWKALLGYRENELSDDLEQFYALSHAEELADTMARARATIAERGAIFDAEFRLRHKNGSWRWMWSHGVVIRSVKGEPERMIGRNLDITDRKKVEEDLRESEERYRLVADAGQVGFWDWDLKTDQVYYSSIWKRQLGFPDDEIGNDFAEFSGRVHAEDREVALGISRSTIQSGERQFVVEFRMLHKDGGWRWIESRGIVMRDATGAAVRVLGTHLDVTGRKRTEEALRTVNVALEERVAARTSELGSANEALRGENAERKRLESELLAIAEREQRRIGRDLHDDLGQQLTAITMQMVALKTRLERESSTYKAAAEDILESLREAIGTTRNLAKGLYPLVVEQGGLEAALEVLATRTQAATGKSCILHVGDSCILPTETAVHLYRIAQEAVNNAIKHGKARRIMIKWGCIEGKPTLEVLNDGLPFVKQESAGGGLGLYLIEKRAKIVGATVEIGERPQGGCGIVCILPHLPGSHTPETL